MATPAAMKKTQAQPEALADGTEGGYDLLDRVIAQTVEKIDRLSTQYLTEMSGAHSTLRKAMVTARSIEMLEQAISPEMMKLILKLMNSPVGFMTDKAPPKAETYDQATVKRCVIEALLNGVDWTNNQFNIIAGRMYITQAGYARKVRDVEELTNLELIPGTPQLVNSTVLIRMGARWKLGGVPQELRDAKGEPGIVFPIISYQGSTPDNLIGKAKRKALKLIYERCTGTESSEDDETPLLNQAVQQPPATKTAPPAEVVTPEGEVIPATAGGEMFPQAGDAGDGPYAQGR